MKRIRQTLVFVVLSLVGATAAVAGPLLDKAMLFEAAIRELHCPAGMVFDAVPGPDGSFERAAGGGDSTIWTGAYIAAEVFRWRATNDPKALEAVETSLKAFHRLHLLGGGDGFLGRFFGRRDWFSGRGDVRPCAPPDQDLVWNPDTSRDQYTGIFLAWSLAWPVIADPTLRAAVASDVLAVGRNLLRNDLALVARIDGRPKSMFNVSAGYCYQDRITPEEWARVDDFPVNAFCRAVPWNATMAAVLATFQPPPIRGGEALRALLMAGTTARITKDAELEAFFRDELCGRRRYPVVASETSQLLSDLFLGINEDTAVRLVAGLHVAITDLFIEAAARFRPGYKNIVSFISPAIHRLAFGVGYLRGKILVGLLDCMRGPEGFAWIGRLAENVEKWAGAARGLGFGKAADRLVARAAGWRAMAGSNLDELSDALRSYVGTNITQFALLGLMETLRENGIEAAARDSIDRAFLPIADEGNSLYTFIRHIHGTASLSADLIAAAKKTLELYPADQRQRRVDNGSEPGLRILPWPDRFERYGSKADRVFPIDRRAPHIFIWQECPRRIVSGSDGPGRIAPVGYLLAYWFGRCYGILTPED
ncbi:MAG TPA: hypothetical protein PLP29_09960 [Candidatus Ozemobacteraceae bacterium]|nr:hypothetical protein [Candidatus Ozemobacteraceae bacterium]